MKRGGLKVLFHFFLFCFVPLISLSLIFFYRGKYNLKLIPRIVQTPRMLCYCPFFFLPLSFCHMIYTVNRMKKSPGRLRGVLNWPILVYQTHSVNIVCPCGILCIRDCPGSKVSCLRLQYNDHSQGWNPEPLKPESSKLLLLL